MLVTKTCFSLQLFRWELNIGRWKKYKIPLKNENSRFFIIA